MLHLPLIDPAAVSAGYRLLTSVPVVLYIGPDQILPVTSFIGGIVGFVLMFWHKLIALTRKVRGRAMGQRDSRTESGV